MLVTYWSIDFNSLFEYSYFYWWIFADKIRRQIQLAKFFPADFWRTKILRWIRLSVAAWGSTGY